MCDKQKKKRSILLSHGTIEGANNIIYSKMTLASKVCKFGV